MGAVGCTDELQDIIQELENYNSLLHLLRKALDNSYQMELPNGVEWKNVLELATEQGVQRVCFEAIEHILRDTSDNIYETPRPSRMSVYLQKLHVDIESNATREINGELLEYKTKLDGTKGLEEKLTEGGFSREQINEALRKKGIYTQKAIKFECFPSAQEINLLLFADIKNRFDVYVFPLGLELGSNGTCGRVRRVKFPLLTRPNSYSELYSELLKISQ